MNSRNVFSEVQNYFNDNGFLSYFLDFVEGSFPKALSSFNTAFPDMGSESNIKAGLTLFYYLYFKSPEVLNKLLDLDPAEFEKRKEYYNKHYGRYFNYFNREYGSTLNHSIFSKIKKILATLRNHWEKKVKGASSKYTDTSSLEEKENRLNMEQELGANAYREFFSSSLLPVNKKEETDEYFEDQLGNSLNIGDAFYIPKIKYANLEYIKKTAIFDKFFKQDDPKKTVEELSEDAAERGRQVWEGYEFPNQEQKSQKETPKAVEPTKDLKIPYPSPSSKKEEPEDAEKKKYLETQSKEQDYLKHNVFKIIKKFMRRDPFGDEIVSWVEGINFDPETGKENYSYKMKIPTYLVSSYKAEFPTEKKDNKKMEEKPRYLIPPRSASEDIDEEIFIHEAIYAALLNIKEAAEGELTPSQAVSEGKKEFYDTKKDKKVIVTPQSGVITVTPEGSGPEEEDVYKSDSIDAIEKEGIKPII